MDFALTEEQQMIQEAARHFADSELKPVAAELDKTADRQLLLDKLKQLAELGFMGINIDPEFGGTGADTVAFSLAITELARGCASTALTTSVTNMVAEVIQAVGSDEQKSKYLSKICSGEYAAGAFCLTEPGSGSDAAAMRSRAVRDGDDYVLNGSKLFISSAEFAGVFVVWAVTDPEAPKGKGISCFLVEAGTPGLVIGKAEEKMGQKASVTNEVSFADCRIPAVSLVGEENKGFRIAAGELAGGRIGIGSLALGIGLEALDRARGYIQEREQFGKKLAQFQGLQWQLADKYTEMEAARLLLMQAAWQKDAGMQFGPTASMAKLYASEKANEACYTALQMHGGVGYTREFPLERMARDVRITTIYEGTSEIQRLIIARHLLEGVR
ncbi:acyl-CoA dehydrogenase family protein [Microbulbifer rhizosphaerae]|uniref:3-sulfinopropanoyl-CoA desulfinase n=1 Tax=Microbulbifer rhizosphaerae TaxID=1562603 RepID=A0A7W4WGS7_9GAMM|nr:acyl-CoA dehydrogenase family protein [Microbulbifer rhizosphaerae]MBB3063398.1 alkylation response protein AidB-like acyl-CoA dehydrogenase [Microbulbifer rhizosphaerae]